MEERATGRCSSKWRPCGGDVHHRPHGLGAHHHGHSGLWHPPRPHSPISQQLRDTTNSRPASPAYRPATSHHRRANHSVNAKPQTDARYRDGGRGQLTQSRSPAAAALDFWSSPNSTPASASAFPPPFAIHAELRFGMNSGETGAPTLSGREGACRSPDSCWPASALAMALL